MPPVSPAATPPGGAGKGSTGAASGGQTAAPPLNRLSRDDNTRLAVLNLAQRQAVVRNQELDGGDLLIGLGRSIAEALVVLVDRSASPWSWRAPVPG